jgi:hypothetical protein
VTAQAVEGSAVSNPDPSPPVVQVTAADFDGAGGACLSLVSSTRKADACITHRRLEDTPAWTVAFADGTVWEVTVDASTLPSGASARSTTSVAGRARR